MNPIELTANKKIEAYKLALECKRSMPVSYGEGTNTVVGSKSIDDRPVMEIAEEIYQWLNKS